MHKMQVFKDVSFGKIYALVIDGKEYFYGSAIAKALGYRNPNAAVTRHCKNIQKIEVQHPQSSDEKRSISVNIISEGDVYRLILNSKLPNAQKFESWVIDEILPSIRKSGIYVTDQTVERMLKDPSLISAMLTQFKQEQDNTQKLTGIIKSTAPLIQFVRDMIKDDENISIEELAKLLSNNGYIIGRNVLFAILRKHRYVTRNNIPTQRAIENGLLVYAQFKNFDSGRIRCRTMVTPKGQIAIYKLIDKIKANKDFEVNNITD